MQMMFHQFQAGDYFEPEGLRREVSTQQNDRPLILIRFPKPRYIGEAFSALILSFPDGRYRYFTIELTLGGKAILGEWAGTGCHINHGILSGHIINAAIDHIYSLYNESLGSSKE